MHEKEYGIRYTDVDFKDRLRLSALLSVMQESACLSADELGFGYADLQPMNIGFILSNWYVELSEPIYYNDKVTIRTWPVKPKKLIVLRDFEIYMGGRKVGVGTSRWCLVDLATFTMLPASAVFGENDGREYNDFRSTDFNSWKIPEVRQGELTYTKYVSYSDYDHYNHVTNTKYGDLLMDAFSVEELKDKAVKTAQISYIRQCKYGDKIDFYKEKSEDGFYLVEGRVDGELRVQMKVMFNDV